MHNILALLLVGCASPLGTAHPTGDGPESEPDAPDSAQDTGLPTTTEFGDNARMFESLFPAELDCGELADAVVVVQNTGATTWTRAEGYKLGAVGDEDPLFDSGDVRVRLDEETTVAPGEFHHFVIDLIGPETEGVETTDWQMVHEGEAWFGEVTQADVAVQCSDVPTDDSEDTTPALPLPNMSHVVHTLADERPDLLADSCLADGGNWGFLDLLVDRLRETDERWGYNWKRGVVGDPSQDVVDYHHGTGEAEGSSEVYIIDVIVGHCGEAPAPGWMDQTEATAEAGTIGIWTSRGRF
jgi:hypothetical protein